MQASPLSSQWLFRNEHLSKTPAVALDGKSVADELALRNQGIEFLSRVGLQLKLSVGSATRFNSAFIHGFLQDGTCSLSRGRVLPSLLYAILDRWSYHLRAFRFNRRNGLPVINALLSLISQGHRWCVRVPRV